MVSWAGPLRGAYDQSYKIFVTGSQTPETTTPSCSAADRSTQTLLPAIMWELLTRHTLMELPQLHRLLALWMMLNPALHRVHCTMYQNNGRFFDVCGDSVRDWRRCCFCHKITYFNGANMKTITENATKLSKYLFDDSKTITGSLTRSLLATRLILIFILVTLTPATPR